MAKHGKHKKRKGAKAGPSPAKAREILHHGEVHGKPLTERQRKFMGARASGQPIRKAK